MVKDAVEPEATTPVPYPVPTYQLYPVAAAEVVHVSVPPVDVRPESVTVAIAPGNTYPLENKVELEPTVLTPTNAA